MQARTALSLSLALTELASPLRRPDGSKKAYVRLTTDYDALDVANKIGTFNVAILANYFKIPFYVACPASTMPRLLAAPRPIDA